MRKFHGKEADKTLTPLEAEFFRSVENQGVVCCSTHFWEKGVYVLGLYPVIRQGEDPCLAGSWLSLN